MTPIHLSNDPFSRLQAGWGPFALPSFTCPMTPSAQDGKTSEFDGGVLEQPNLREDGCQRVGRNERDV